MSLLFLFTLLLALRAILAGLVAGVRSFFNPATWESVPLTTPTKTHPRSAHGLNR